MYLKTQVKPVFDAESDYTSDIHTFIDEHIHEWSLCEYLTLRKGRWDLLTLICPLYKIYRIFQKYMSKQKEMIESFLNVAYNKCYYSVLDGLKVILKTYLLYQKINVHQKVSR